MRILKVSFVGENMIESDYSLLTKHACTWHACRSIVLQGTSGIWAEIVHGMTSRHPY